MTEPPRGIGPKLGGSVEHLLNRAPKIPALPDITPVVYGPTNFWCEGNVGPVAQKALSPTATALVFTLARDLLNTMADLGMLGDHIKDLTGQLGGAWSAGQGAVNATAKLRRIHGCFGTLGEQAGKLQHATDALGGTMRDMTTSMLQTLGISNATCAALGSNPFTAPAAKGTAWGTVMNIVKWLLAIKTAITAITDSVHAIKEVTREVDATAVSLGAPTGGGTSAGYGVPAGYGIPAGYGQPPAPVPGVPTSAGSAATLPALPPLGRGIPTVYNSGAYPPGGYGSGWLPEAADGVDADGDHLTITVAGDGKVTVDVPDDQLDNDLKIRVDAKGEQYTFDIDARRS